MGLAPGTKLMLVVAIALLLACVGVRGCEDAKSMLQKLNAIRWRHQSPPLVWNTSLELAARKYAQGLAAGTPACRVEHSNFGGGEIMWGFPAPESKSSSTLTFDADYIKSENFCRSVVAAWHGEIAFHNFTATPNDHSPTMSPWNTTYYTTGHFESIVWRTAASVGCAAAVNEDETCFVTLCQFLGPNGQFRGGYPVGSNKAVLLNVWPPRPVQPDPVVYSPTCEDAVSFCDSDRTRYCTTLYNVTFGNLGYTRTELCPLTCGVCSTSPAPPPLPPARPPPPAPSCADQSTACPLWAEAGGCKISDASTALFPDGLFEGKTVAGYWCPQTCGSCGAPPSPPPSPPPECHDIMPTVSCKMYVLLGWCGKQINSDQYPGQPLISSLCRLTCGVCTDGKPRPPPPPPVPDWCQNDFTDGQCANYAASGWCLTYVVDNRRVQDACQRTCGTCKRSSEPDSPPPPVGVKQPPSPPPSPPPVKVVVVASPSPPTPDVKDSPPPPPPSCGNVLQTDWCESWTAAGYCTSEWVYEGLSIPYVQCRESCGMCDVPMPPSPRGAPSPPPLPPSPPVVCEDVLLSSACVYYVDNKLCTDDALLSTGERSETIPGYWCRKTCGTCNATSSGPASPPPSSPPPRNPPVPGPPTSKGPPPAECVDRLLNNDCDFYVKKGYCTSSDTLTGQPIAWYWCRKACGLCQSSGPASPPPSRSSPPPPRNPPVPGPPTSKAPPPAPECADRLLNNGCDFYVKNGYCTGPDTLSGQSIPTYWCRKSCGICN